MAKAPAQIKHNDQKKRTPLWEDVLSFSKNKYVLAVTLVGISALGLIIPVIPGLLLVILAIALFKRGWMSKIRNRLNLRKKR